MSSKSLFILHTHERVHSTMSKLLLCVHVFIYLSLYFTSSNARCCQTKIVGDQIYTFVARRDQVYGNCRNGCTYRKNDSDSLLCFAAGEKMAECQEGGYWWWTLIINAMHWEDWLSIKTVQCTIGNRKHNWILIIFR